MNNFPLKCNQSEYILVLSNFQNYLRTGGFRRLDRLSGGCCGKFFSASTRLRRFDCRMGCSDNCLFGTLFCLVALGNCFSPLLNRRVELFWLFIVCSNLMCFEWAPKAYSLIWVLWYDGMMGCLDRIWVADTGLLDWGNSPVRMQSSSSLSLLIVMMTSSFLASTIMQLSSSLSSSNSIVSTTDLGSWNHNKEKKKQFN